MQLCDAFDLPVLLLCDTPGIMVGPEVEKTALVRHCSRMFVVGANLTVPFCTIVLRKGYGLGAQAMAGGSFKAPFFTVAWPTGEFGGMGLEGAVKLGFRNELAGVEDPEQRKALFEQMVGARLRHRQGAEHRLALRDRRRDRPDGVAALDQHGPAVGARTGPAGAQEAAVHRRVVAATRPGACVPTSHRPARRGEAVPRPVGWSRATAPGRPYAVAHRISSTACAGVSTSVLSTRS